MKIFSEFRNKGIATRLMNEIENVVSKNYPKIGLGVGLYSDYGIAQKMYVKRGYIPDGNGIFYKNKTVNPGFCVKVDDDLVLYMTKTL